jgi:hypothetical protein
MVARVDRSRNGIKAVRFKSIFEDVEDFGIGTVRDG